MQINSLLTWCKSSAEVFGGRRAGDRRYIIDPPSGVIENPGSLYGGGGVFFVREEHLRVDGTILPARGDYSLHF
jgi:hypothetical protein